MSRRDAGRRRHRPFLLYLLRLSARPGGGEAAGRRRARLRAAVAELMFEVSSQRHERGSTIPDQVRNHLELPFEDWTQVLGSERLTGALLDRLTRHLSILAMNGDSYRLKQSTGRNRSAAKAEQDQAIEIVDPETGEIIKA